MSAADFEKMVKEIFAKSDVNNDGVLVLDEFKQFTLHILQACSCLDISEDGSDIDAMFARFDANKDGRLDWGEIWAAVQPMQAKLK